MEFIKKIKKKKKKKKKKEEINKNKIINNMKYKIMKKPIFL